MNQIPDTIKEGYAIQTISVNGPGEPANVTRADAVRGLSDIENLEREDRIKFLRKMNEVKKKVLACDWTPDKVNTGFGYKYVSDGKILRNIMPILAACGVDFIVNYDNPVELKPLDKMQHWIIDTHAYFVDIDTGYIGDRLYAPGEGSDAASGSLYKAKTFGRKTILVSYFGITDNIEIDTVYDKMGGGFKPRTEEETVEIKAKISDVAMKPPAPKAKNMPKPKEATETPQEGEKAEESTSTPAKPAKPVKAPSKEKGSTAEYVLGVNLFPKFTVSTVQLKAAQKVIDRWDKACKDGTVTHERYEKVIDDFKEVTSINELIDFMKSHAEVEE